MQLILVILLVCLSPLSRAQLCDFFADQAGGAITEPCLKQLKVMCNNGSLWWQMVDASSKYPISGMSYGSNKDLGSFDQCVDLNYRSSEGDVMGKFCAYSVGILNFFLDPIPSPWKLDITPKSLAHVSTVNYTSRADITDLYSITMLSLCIPDQCTVKETAKFFIWGQLENISLVNFIDTVPCMTKETNTDFQWGDIVFTLFLSLIGFLMICSTIYDILLQKTDRKPFHPVLLAFSVLTNGKKILHVSTGNPDQIQCLNGLRFISMMWVIAGHNFVALESVPLINYSTMDEYQNRVDVQYIGAAPIAVDTFFFLSGFLLCFGYLKNNWKHSPVRQLLGVPMMILHRYLRLTPALAVAFFASITIFRMIGTGPLWGIVTNQLSQQCVNHWWDFFLYIQNYVSYNDMCLNHTWYLSADMQMFILSPIVLIPLSILYKKDMIKEALAALVALTAICVGFPMLIRFLDHSIDNVYDTHSRFNDYLIGMILGVILRHSSFKKFPFSKLANLTIWCAVLVICISFVLYYHHIIRVYQHTSDTLFYGLYRPIWCASLAWMVYSCYHGRGGPINWILSLPAFQIGARLSYCMYLLHAIVQMYWVGLARTSFYWGDYTNFYVWCGHFVVTMLMSAIWSLAFESPMIVIEKFIFGGGGRRPQQTKTKQ